jgi:hypothetical protein
LGVELQPYPVKKKVVEKPPRNSSGFCGGGQGLTGLWSQGRRRRRRRRKGSIMSGEEWNMGGRRRNLSSGAILAVYLRA